MSKSSTSNLLTGILLGGALLALYWLARRTDVIREINPALVRWEGV